MTSPRLERMEKRKPKARKCHRKPLLSFTALKFCERHKASSPFQPFLFLILLWQTTQGIQELSSEYSRGRSNTSETYIKARDTNDHPFEPSTANSILANKFDNVHLLSHSDANKRNLDFREMFSNKSNNFSKNMKHFHEIILNADLSSRQEQIVNDLLNNPKLLKQFFSKSDLFPSITRAKRQIFQSRNTNTIIQKVRVKSKRDVSKLSAIDQHPDMKERIITSVGKFHIQSQIRKSLTQSSQSSEAAKAISKPKKGSPGELQDREIFQRDDPLQLVETKAFQRNDPPLLPESQAYKSNRPSKKTAIDHFFDRYQQFLQSSVMVPEMALHTTTTTTSTTTTTTTTSTTTTSTTTGRPYRRSGYYFNGYHSPVKPTKPLFEYPVRASRYPYLLSHTKHYPRYNTTKWYMKQRYLAATRRNATKTTKTPRFKLKTSGFITKASEDQWSHLPEELRPIHPGGGSKFDDWEREKLERNKLAQRKGLEAANSKHDAEGFRSCSICEKFQLGEIKPRHDPHLFDCHKCEMK